MLGAPESADREQLRQLLAHRRDELYMRIRELRRDQEIEAEPPPADTMEAARASAEIETHAGLIGTAEDQLVLIDEALDRIERGAYGVCLDCGEEIATARLSAVPATRYCLECQNSHAVVQRRRSEGIMIQPYDQIWTVPEEMRDVREYRVRTGASHRAVQYEETPPADANQPVKTLFPKPESSPPRRRK